MRHIIQAIYSIMPILIRSLNTKLSQIRKQGGEGNRECRRGRTSTPTVLIPCTGSKTHHVDAIDDIHIQCAHPTNRGQLIGAAMRGPVVAMVAAAEGEGVARVGQFDCLGVYLAADEEDVDVGGTVENVVVRAVDVDVLIDIDFFASEDEREDLEAQLDREG